MINLYLNKRILPKDRDWVEIIDPPFNRDVRTFKLTQDEIAIMQRLENTTLVENGGNSVLNKYGMVVSLDKISSGLKTILLISYYKRNSPGKIGIYLNQCGENYLDTALEQLDDCGFPGLLSYRPSNVLEFKDREMLINNKFHIHTVRELHRLIWSRELQCQLED